MLNYIGDMSWDIIKNKKITYAPYMGRQLVGRLVALSLGIFRSTNYSKFSRAEQISSYRAQQFDLFISPDANAPTTAAQSVSAMTGP